MKWALDAWYELWENLGNEERPSPEVNPDEKDRHLPGLEDLPSADHQQQEK
jgi:hypothetical protein